MARINITIDAKLDTVLSFIAEQRNVTKSMIAREFLDAGKNQLLFPVLAALYKDGKISLKKIVTLSGLHHVEAIERLSRELDDAPLTPQNDAYTGKNTEKLLDALKA